MYVCIYIYIYIYIYPEVPTVPLNGTGHIIKQNGPKNRTVPQKTKQHVVFIINSALKLFVPQTKR